MNTQAIGFIIIIVVIIIVRLFSIVAVPFRFTGRVTTSMALMDYSGIHRSRGCPTNRGLSQVFLYMPTTD